MDNLKNVLKCLDELASDILAQARDEFWGGDVSAEYLRGFDCAIDQIKNAIKSEAMLYNVDINEK